MTKTRVLVVDDLLTIRKKIREVLSSDPQLEVIGEAGDGKAAIQLCLERRPDVITLDMMLPVMSGLAVTEYIMAHCPTPIVVVSASFNRGELYKTYDALAAGAVDVLEKPNGNEPDGTWEKALIDRVKMVARIPVITHPRARLATLWHAESAPAEGKRGDHRPAVLAIGASTGGPAAIVEVLQHIPLSVEQPILLVLHISEPFGASFAHWLDGQSGRRVAYANDGDSVASVAGRVIMAPPGRHLVVRDGRLRLTDDPERHSCRPSIDVLFESVAHAFPGAVGGALLTGMGRDGAAGLLAIRRSGGATIAQDEASSVVYGMPREAAALGAAEQILPLSMIGAALTALAAGTGGRA